MHLPLTAELTMAHSCLAKSSKENLLPKLIDPRDTTQESGRNQEKQARQSNNYPQSNIMLLLTTATAANANLPEDCYDEDFNKAAMPSKSPTSKGLNQMETEESEELGKHLNDFVQQNKDDKEPVKGVISLALAIPSFTPPLIFLSVGCPRLANARLTTYLLGINSDLSSAIAGKCHGRYVQCS